MTTDADQRVVVDLDDTDGRYHRQTLISWWDQDRLAAAKVLVVGAGALGNELVKNLALLGVGTIVVVDLDMVENSNLSRCVLLRESDEGAPKATAVARGAAAMNPDVRVVPVIGDVRTGFGLRLFREVDLVIGGLDNREARLYVNQSCWKAGTPWIDGAIEGLLGTMRVFSPPDSACYECTMGDRDHELLAARKACSLLTRDQMLEGKVPTTATSASIIAAMQVQEAVKLLHRDRLDADFSGRGVAYNGITHDSYVVTYPRREDCLSHDTYNFDDATEMPAGVTFGTLLEDARERLGADAVLDFEREIATTMACGTCDEVVAVMRPLDGLTVGAALCSTCGGERRVELLHGVTGDDAELLAMTPEAVGLPPRDVVTGRSGVRRWHYLLGGPFTSLADLATP
jgi:molybdopterin/thiamine biosynthesis adenylyltransferase